MKPILSLLYEEVYVRLRLMWLDFRMATCNKMAPFYGEFVLKRNELAQRRLFQ